MTVKSVTARRFKAIVDAYGADPKRWPDADCAGALAFVQRHPEEAKAWLDEAREIDGLLDTLPASERLSLEESQAVHGRALARLAPLTGTASAEVVAFRPRLPRPAPVIWATGIGIAACIAGAIFGVNLSLSSLGDLRAQNVLEQAQLIDSES